MALEVPISVYLLFNAMTALTEEAAVTVTPPITAQQADNVEGPIALKFSHLCLEDHNSYCINGACAFHHELEKAICRCLKLKSPYNVCSGERRPL
ncbi:PREDICTED: epigen isoform X6 [Mandrillus leucophaeus]|uniref:epigen isoform X6 n=1 Tax=Mandrillus leucophaeus TaxID=9568 RepID=UPI0005F5080E|nr:PREDICTED: epigen isoform X6 [Mandrillus leucophaeus]XP_025242220.1 epigen isoform X6 [Theropithecus gelada]